MAAEPLRVLVSSSEAATRAFAEALGRALGPGDVVLLHGDLGTGKTTFVRGLARGLDVLDAVQSPTYVLMQSYQGRCPFFHLDAYLDGRERAFLIDGGAEWLSEDGVCAVEWAERVADLLPPVRLVVTLAHRSPETRRIALAVEGPGAAAADLAARVGRVTLPAGLAELPDGPAPAEREARRGSD